MKSSTLMGSTYDRIRQDILSGRLAPDQKLGIELLKELYGAGATPIREALNRLAAQGWVEYLDQRGFAVASVSAEALEELTQTRIGVEGLALRRAIENKSAAWEESVVLAQHRMSKVPRSLSSTDYQENPEWELLHRKYHMTLISHCGSRWLIQFCEQLYDQAYRYRQLAAKLTHQSRDIHAEHRAVVDAISASNPDAAVFALTAHYQKTTRVLSSSTH